MLPFDLTTPPFYYDPIALIGTVDEMIVDTHTYTHPFDQTIPPLLLSLSHCPSLSPLPLSSLPIAVIGTLEEMIDDTHAIVSSTHGPEYYVSVMSFVNQDLLEPGCSVLLHNKVSSQ